MRKPILLVASHLLCFAVGAVLIRAGNVAQTNGGGTGGQTKSHIREHRGTTVATGEDVARKALAESHEPPFDTDAARELAARKYAGGEGEKKVRELAAKGMTAPGESTEFAGAWLAWFRDDPAQAMRFMEGFEEGEVRDAVLAAAMKGMDPAARTKLARDSMRSPIKGQLFKTLAATLAALDPPMAAGLIAGTGDEDQNLRFYADLVRNWPDGNTAAFLEMAIASNNAQELIAFFMTAVPPRKASELMVLMDSREDLPEALVKILAEGGELKGHLYRYADPSVSLDERIAQMRNLSWLKDATPEALRDGALKQISTVDINELMKNGTDYRYAFRQGAMTAGEVLDAVKKQLPELAAATEYETRVRVFNELASENAAAAFALIADLPEEQRNMAVLHQSRWTFRDNSPDAFLSMISLAPGPDSAAAAPVRADAWKVYGRSAYQDYGDYYLDWVRNLPPGVNRDAARSTLAEVLRMRKQEALATEFEKR